MMRIRGRDLILPLTEMTAGKPAMITMSEMTTLLHQKERKNAWRNHQDCQMNMIRIRSGDPVVVMMGTTVVMLILV